MSLTLFSYSYLSKVNCFVLFCFVTIVSAHTGEKFRTHKVMSIFILWNKFSYFSNIISSTTEVPQAPGAPETERISPTSVQLSWSRPYSDGGSDIVGYIVEKKEKSGRWTPVTADTIDDTSFTVKGLREGEDVEFRITAVNKAGPGKPSQVTLLSAKPPGPPGRPDVSDINKTSATVTWTAPKSDGGSTITGYIVERREKGRDRWTRVNRKPIDDLKLKVTDLVEKTDYEFRVIAENKAGLGQPSEPSVKFVAKAPYGMYFNFPPRDIVQLKKSHYIVNAH